MVDKIDEKTEICFVCGEFDCPEWCKNIKQLLNTKECSNCKEKVFILEVQCPHCNHWLIRED